MRDYLTELEIQCDNTLASLSHIELLKFQCESEMLKQEKHSLKWMQLLADLNGLNKKENLIRSRLGSLKIQLINTFKNLPRHVF